MEIVDIIIPSYGQVDAVLTCLESVRYYSRNYRLIFVDNGSSQDDFEEIWEELSLHPHQLVRNYKNLGFIRAVNQGLSLSTSPYVVLLNNDTEVTKNWLEKLHYPFTENKKIAAVGPVTNAKDCWQGTHSQKDSWMLCSQTTMLAFFCVMLQREAIQKIGLLDESFGVGFADDDDYCRRLHLAGYRIALAENCLVYHQHRTTFSSLYSHDQLEQMVKTNLDIFRTKYKVDKDGNPL